MSCLEHVSLAEQPVRLNRFDRKSFAGRIQAELTPDMTPDDARELLYRKIPLGQSELVAPAINGVIVNFAPLWMRNGGSPQTQAERTIYETSRRITSTSHKPPKDPREQQLQALYRESQRNYAAFSAFGTLRSWIPSAEKFYDQATTRWQTLQEESLTTTPPDEQAITSVWQTLRASLQKEKERGHSIQEAHREDFGPLVLSTAEVEEQEQSMHSIIQTVDALIAIPAYHSARILWDTILTEQERIAIIEQRTLFDLSKKDLALAKTLSSYKDPVILQEFVDTDTNIAALLENTRFVYQVIRAYIIDNEWDYYYLYNTLADSEHKQKPFGKPNKLTRYLDDVATVFLMTGIN